MWSLGEDLPMALSDPAEGIDVNPKNASSLNQLPFLFKFCTEPCGSVLLDLACSQAQAAPAGLP